MSLLGIGLILFSLVLIGVPIAVSLGLAAVVAMLLAAVAETAPIALAKAAVGVVFVEEGTDLAGHGLVPVGKHDVPVDVFLVVDPVFDQFAVFVGLAFAGAPAL